MYKINHRIILLNYRSFDTDMIDMKTILIGALLIFHSSVFAQLGGPCDIMVPHDSTDWGIGVIKCSDQYFTGVNRENKTFYISKDSIRAFNSKAMAIGDEDVTRVGHVEYLFLKVFEIKNTQYKVLVNTIEGGLWVDFNQLDSKGIAFNTYYSILFNDNPNGLGQWRKSLRSLGVNLFESCLNMRAQPSLDSKIVRCISKNVNDLKFHRISIAYHKDAWAYIVVHEYVSDSDGGEGCQYKIQSEFSGWVKAVDDKGYPNLWFSLTAY
jgi:hypothetical protein